ncbi:MAG: hypothetical protein AB7D96_10620 [Arcobacteraceae bacterium]
MRKEQKQRIGHLRRIGENLLNSDISICEYRNRKKKLRKRGNKTIKLRKDKGSKVLIQKELF